MSSDSLPLLFIPGMMCDARLFRPQIKALADRYPVYVANLIEGDRIEDLAAHILSETAAREFALAGLSMGGIVAMEMLRQAPERIKKIALLDTNPRAELEDVKQRREPQIAKVQAGGLRDVMRDEMKPNYLADTPQRDQILDLCMDMALKLGPEIFVKQSRALQSRPDQQDILTASDCPALILCGREDLLCPIERHELMHHLMKNSHLEIIDQAGHLPTLEQPIKTNQALLRWMER